MSKLCKKLAAGLLAALLLIGSFTFALPDEGIMKVKAAEVGQCGDNLTWTLDDDGTLTISGAGAMWDWSDCLSDSDAPWGIYCEDIKEISISDGVTEIADCAFFGCGSVTSISIPDSVMKINESAFNGCNALSDVYYYGTEEDWGNISIADFNAPLLNANIHYIYDDPVSATEITLDDTAVSVDDDIAVVISSADTADAVISDSSFADVDDEFVTETVPDIYTENVTAEGEIVEVPATEITLDKASLSVNKGETAKLTAAVTPADSTDTVVWTSSNNAVATVSDGTVTAVAVGTCTVTATAGSVKATCTVTVIDSGILPAPSTVTAARASINSIKVTWSAVSGAGGYYVYRSADGEKFTKVKTLAAKVKTFTDTKLTCGKTYYYKVAAYATKNGTKITGTVSNIVSAKPYPNKPSMSSAKCVSNYKITVKWGSASGVTGYKLYRSANGGEYKLIKTTKSRSYTDTGVVPGVTYSYKVTSYKGSGESKMSSAKSAKTKLPAPGSFKAASQSAAGKIKLTWKRVTGATGYKVYRYDSATANYLCVATLAGNNKLSYTDSGLADRTTYKYKVYAYRTAGGLTGLGTATSVKSAKTATPPGTINVIGALAELRVKFPDGKYWNHVGYSAQRPNSYTSSPCPAGHKGNCNGQCAGFAAKLGVDIFGTSASSWGKRYTNTKWSSIKSKICIGDIIRYNSKHSIVVTGIEGDNIYVADCNWNSRCRISWDRAFPTAKYFKTINFVYHNPSNNFKSNDSTLYLKGDFSDTIGKVTVYNPDPYYNGPLTNENDLNCYGYFAYRNGANVRASADDSANVVGITVDGDVFYCYDKKSVNGEMWYKIKLDTVSGWISEYDVIFTAA